MTTAKLYIGVDVAKATLAVATATQFLCEVSNTPEGIKKLLAQLAKLSVTAVVLESTGIYGQALVEALMQAGYSVAVVQPGRVRHFAKSQNQHAKTDAIDAKMIARYAETSPVRLVEKRPGNMVELRALTDRREQIIQMRVSEENHRESNCNKNVSKEIEKNIARLLKQEKEYDRKIKALIDADKQLATKRDLLEQEAGVGPKTAAALLAHMPELGTVNRQQIAALGGLVPYNNDSGTMHGKRAIYGGRKQIRKSLYLAALSAVKWSEWIKSIYVTLCKKGKPKKVALIACARKLLIRLNSLLAAAYKNPNETALLT
jgi:transposase